MEHSNPHTSQHPDRHPDRQPDQYLDRRRFLLRGAAGVFLGAGAANMRAARGEDANRCSSVRGYRTSSA